MKKVAKKAVTKPAAAAAKRAQAAPGKVHGPANWFYKRAEIAQAKARRLGEAKIGKPRAFDFPRKSSTGVQYAGSRENDPKAYDGKGRLLCTCGKLVVSIGTVKRRRRMCGACFVAHFEKRAQLRTRAAARKGGRK